MNHYFLLTIQVTIDEIRHATQTMAYASAVPAYKPTTIKRDIVGHFKREYPSLSIKVVLVNKNNLTYNEYQEENKIFTQKA